MLNGVRGFPGEGGRGWGFLGGRGAGGGEGREGGERGVWRLSISFLFFLQLRMVDRAVSCFFWVSFVRLQNLDQRK